MSNFTSQPIMLARSIPPSDPNYAWIARNPNSELWTLYCKNGPTFVWSMKENTWVCITKVKAENFGMHFAQAHKLLETIDTVQALQNWKTIGT